MVVVAAAAGDDICENGTHCKRKLDCAVGDDVTTSDAKVARYGT
jgi:hypothetical protein